ncbi:MAG: hypothetical protein R2794_12595 [Chitinophagales bacterium]
MSSYILIGMLALSVQGVFGQTQEIESYEKDKSEKEHRSSRPLDNILVGGSFSAMFGQTSYLEISPQVGYLITPHFLAGIGGTYEFLSQNYNSPSVVDYKANVYGARVFLEHDLFFDFFAHAEYAKNWYTVKYEDYPLAEESNTYPEGLVGLGYNSFAGDKGRFQIILLYDLIQDAYSISASPFSFRLVFMTGL